MPRQARLDVPGALHHVMVRGINKSVIFKDDQDKSRFLQRLGENITEAQASVYAWVLMDNHVHILFKSGAKGISAVMRKLLTWYAQYFNRRHGRTGHLFENRYKSILCEEENYLLALMRYIHLNSLRAKVITTLGELDYYFWSGHSTIMGYSQNDWMDTAYVLLQFGSRKKAARAAYRRFMEEGIALGRSPELTGGGLIRTQGGWSQVVAMRRRGQKIGADERILGSGDFVTAILKEAEDRQLRQFKLRRAGKTIEDIIDEECRKRGVSIPELKGSSRRQRISQTRTVVAFRGREELGLSAAEMARHLGVNTSSITRAIDRLEKQGDKQKTQ